MARSSAKFQYLAGIVVNMMSIVHGIQCGWSSPNIVLLTSDETPLPSGKITMEEASWVASLFPIGGLIGNICFGFITNRFGRKMPLIFITIPTIASWSLILYAQNFYFLTISRILSGFVSGGIFGTVPGFLSEIANDRVRGFLGSTLVFSCNIGVLLAFVFGNYFSFYMTPKFVILLTILFGFSFFFFPETPLMAITKRNDLSEAERSIRFYQNLKKNIDYEVLQSEMNKLKNSLQVDNVKKYDSIKWCDLTSGAGRKAMIIGIVLAVLNQLCGCFAMLQYTANIFEEAGSTMVPNMSAIVVAVIQLIGSYVATILVDRAGRKFLFIVSSIGIATGLITLGIYMMLKTWGYDVEIVNWIPLFSFSFAIFVANFAVLTLPFLVISEIMPEKLKDLGTSFCMVILSCFAFMVVKCLPFFIKTFEFHGTMFLFAGVCLSSVIFIICYMPETKSKSYDEIQKSLLPSGKVTVEECSWIASLMCLGALVGNSFFGTISSKFGRKIGMLSLTLPTIIAWTLVIFAQNVYYLYASRAINGFVGGGVFVIIPVYLSEIASDRVRGALGSMLVLTCNIGALLAFVFGAYLNYFTTPKFVIALMVVSAIAIWFLPETPPFLYSVNKITEAEKSIRFYQDLKGKENDFQILQFELNKLKNTVGGGEKNEINTNSFSWSDITNGPGKKAMIIGIVLALLNQFCGCFAMLQYTADIFTAAGSSMEPNDSAILVGLLQLIGSAIPSVLVDRTGRKFLFLVSTIGIALGLTTLGTYMMLKGLGYPVQSFSWIPIVGFSFVICIANFAVLTLPFLVISEIMPVNLKSFGPSVCMIIMWASAFLIIKCMPLMTAALGLNGVMYFFAGICLSCAIFIMLCIPETNGRSYDEIMQLLE
ncbi:facilitated trehalose transporter Tret1-like [Contarinia nasturtii]|uniref:facilitated trehalose transporter Tret1-like n=1 Tax=Contarinia nasturtii TaxID=265458 RepID=UPI0012D3A023|nr:facilitated trehalose transporter Tret1-like [Contarinia nasturtii]